MSSKRPLLAMQIAQAALWKSPGPVVYGLVDQCGGTGMPTLQLSEGAPLSFTVLTDLYYAI